MRVAEVVLDISTRAIDSTYTYLVPAGMNVQVGQCVEVEFAHRPSIGYVMDISERPSEDFGDISLRPISRILTISYFDSTSAQLARWIASEYLSTLPEAVRLLMPPGAAPKFRHLDNGEWLYVAPSVAPVDDRWAMLTPEGWSFEPRKSATKQLAVIDALKAGEMRVAELGISIGSVSSTLKALEKKGVVKVESRRRIRGMDEGPNGQHPFGQPGGGQPGASVQRGAGQQPGASQQRSADVHRSTDILHLTKGQSDALEAIDKACQRACGDVVVMDGVTGSGKTEVYLQTIRHVIDAGGTACVLVPEISLTPQTVGRFRSRFGDKVAVLHSRLSVGERYDQWSLVRSGEARVVVGARSALFAPMPNLKLIVIDEEHESSYKQGSAPRYSSRDVAVKLAQLRGATLVLGSASPSIETLYNCKIGKWERVELKERASGKPLPLVQIVDLSNEFGSGNKTMFSRSLSHALEETMEAGEKAVLLLNRRGFASFLLCRECGYVPTCEQCSTSLTFHEDHSRHGRYGAHASGGRGGTSGSQAGHGAGFLMCHHCGRRFPVPARCPKCGSPYLRQLGPGTQFAYDQLRALLGPDVPIIRMDADTTSTKGAHEKLLSEFIAADRGVLLGTQMIAKGLDFPDVTLAGVLIADTTLKLPDFRASERTFQLIEQVAGRAGRAEKDGRVIVQTYWPNHPAIVAASHHDRDRFLAGELPIRKEMGYPPYKRLANILLWGKNESAVAREAGELRRLLDLRLKHLSGEDEGYDALGGGIEFGGTGSHGAASSSSEDDFSFEQAMLEDLSSGAMKGTAEVSDLPPAVAKTLSMFGDLLGDGFDASSLDDDDDNAGTAASDAVEAGTGDTDGDAGAGGDAGMIGNADTAVSGSDGDVAYASGAADSSENAGASLDDSLDADAELMATFDIDEWEILGPSPCLLSKLRGTFRWHILVKAPVGANVSGMIAPVLKQRKASEGVSVAVDVDPMDLF